MKENSSTARLSAMRLGSVLAGVVALAIVNLSAQSGTTQPAATGITPKSADQAFKNIQILKGIAADQLIPSMQFMAVSLGVECDFCHVEGAFERDDKKPKRTARQMIQMLFSINQNNFDGRREVTCYSCHRGAREPIGTPIIGEEELGLESARVMRSEPARDNTRNPVSSAAADQILAQYLQALGGEAAIHKISSRIEKGTVTAFGGHQFPVEVFTKAPDKRMSVMHLPNGDSTTAFDGHIGWLGAPSRGVREMNGEELEGAKLDADFYFPLRLKQIFSKLEVQQPEKVGDQETNVVSGLNDGQAPVRLYFDQRSGLLVRLLRYAESPLGPNPTRIDYADYRDQGGAKIPFRWTLARPSGRFTIQVTEVEQNVPIDDQKFAKPATQSPAPGKP